MVDRTIEANEKLAASNERYSKATIRLTRGLLIVAALQVIVEIIIPLVQAMIR